MNKLTKSLLEDLLDNPITVALYGGSFKPPTKGHFNVVKETLQKYPEIDELIVYVGSGERDGVTQEESIKIWEIYKNYLSDKVTIKPAVAPIKAILNYAKENPTQKVYWVLGARECQESDFTDIACRTKSVTKYPNIEVKIITSSGGVNGTKTRQAVKTNDKQLFFNLIPDVKEKEEIWDMVKPLVKETKTRAQIIKEQMQKYNTPNGLEEGRKKKPDPKKGTGKKPKGSGRRLYTDEDPKDTVGIKFKTKEDIVDTLNKASFKAKSHARQSQIINLIHQRVRAAYGKAKDPEVKARLKRGLDYIESRKEASKEKTKRLNKLKENQSSLNYKNIEFGQGSGDKLFDYYYPDLSSIGATQEQMDNTYLATNKKRHLHVQIDPSLQGKGLAAEIIKAFIYREGYRVIPKGRITNPDMIKVLDKIKQDPKFSVEDDGDEYIIDEKYSFNEQYLKESSNPQAGTALPYGSGFAPIKELVTATQVICDKCGWKWNKEDGGKDLYMCHKCGHDNTPKSDPFGLIQATKDFVKEVFNDGWSFKEGMLSLTKYMMDNGMNIKPLPKIKVIKNDVENASHLLGKTAHYDPVEKSITLFTMNRHPKDVLRSFAHEMIHHQQNLENRLNNIATTNTNEDGDLPEIEREAYEKGNMMFRNWEDNVKSQKYLKEYKQKALTELFEKDLPYVKKINQKSYIVGNGNDIEAKFYFNLEIPERDLWSMNWSFTPNNTNKSPESWKQVTATSFKVLEDWLKTNNPKAIYISGNTGAKTKLYKNYVEKIQTLLNNRYKIDNSNEDRVVLRSIKEISQSGIKKRMETLNESYQQALSYWQNGDINSKSKIERWDSIKKKIQREVLCELYNIKNV